MNSTIFSNAEPLYMGWLDISMFCAVLGLSAIIGIYFGFFSGRQDSANEYLRGGKTMGVFPVSLSLLASFVSGITMLGMPSEVYRYGTQYWAINIAVLMVGLTVATVYVPLYSKLQISSCYEYLELRFNRSVRRMASILFVLSQIFYIPIVVYVPALAFSQVTAINVHLITPITCLVCIFYTTIGGLRGVVWTDALQTMLMFAAMFTVLILGFNKVGGWGEVWERSSQGQRLQFFNLNPNPLERLSFWTVVIGIYVQFLSECGVGQGFVQRYLSVPNLRTAKLTILWYSLGLALVGITCNITGILLYASYYQCDPLTSKRVSQPDQLLPLYVTEVASHIPGLSGLFVAGVFSAALSSMSTGLNAMSGVLVEDIMSNYLSSGLRTATWLKIITALAGVLCVLLVLVVEKLGGVLQAAFSLSGITSGPMLGLFNLGMFFPRANSKGALIGSVVSLILMTCIVFGTQSSIASGALKHQTLPLSVEMCAINITVPEILPHDNSEVWWFFRISYMYYSLVGSVTVLIVGYFASIALEEDKQPEINSDLFSPLVHRFLSIKQQENIDLNEVKPFMAKKSNGVK